MHKPTREAAIKRLQRQLDAIPELKNLRYGSPAFTEWKRNTKVAITYTFGESAEQVKEFEAIGYFAYVISEQLEQQAYIQGLDEAASTLRSMIHEIQEYWPDEPQEPSIPEATETPQSVNTNRVFLIHGRDHSTRDTVARFLESLGLVAVILEEQPNRGRTIIEKFEEHVQGDFAVALLTPDDMGGLSNGELQPRARQNVIFEFRYCIGTFGRGRVVALVKGEPEIPSDYSGVLYIPMDERGAWRNDLIREMKSTGIDIDANRAYE